MLTIDCNRKVIGNALIWAAMMIAAALLMQDSGNGTFMILLMVAGWFGSNGLVSSD